MAFSATSSSYKTVEFYVATAGSPLGSASPALSFQRRRRPSSNLSPCSPRRAAYASNMGVLERSQEVTCDASVLAAAGLLDWGFNAIGKPKDELSRLIIPVFRAFDLSRDFDISDETLLAFAAEVEVRYHDNPFHSYAHAWTVLQACVHIVHDLGSFANSILEKIDVLALFVAALCHDMDHPGTNNSFQQKTYSPLALLYNDESILENHHAALCFEVLGGAEGANIFAGLSQAEFRTVRRHVCTAILSTDMSRHDRDLARVRAHLCTPLRKSNQDDRQLVISTLLHAADLSNPARPPDLAEEWARRVAEEFCAQAVKEEEAGVEVSKFMLAGYQEKNEIFFIRTYVKPLWDAVTSLMPPLRPFAVRVNSLLALYQERVEAQAASSA